MEFKDVENARIIYHKKLSRIWTIGLIIGAVIAALTCVFSGISGGFDGFTIFLFLITLGFAAMIVGVVVLFATRKQAEAYQEAYKKYFVEKNMAAIFSNLKYDHKVGLNRDMLKVSGMVNTGDRYHSNDLAMANYKGVNFVQADVHIETEHTDSEGNTTYVTIFRGRFMVFEFPKKFSFKLELIGKKYGSAYRVPGKNPKTGRKMAKLNTESGDFNRNFRIFAEDGFEAFYILDPAFMEKIQKISDAYNGRILMGFLDNTLLIGLNDGKDSFEPPKSSKVIDEKAETAKIAGEIRVITDFVDVLKLDRKLFVN